MTDLAKPHEIVWLKEMERRIASNIAIDNREMMVALRAELPRGFRPSDVSGRLLYGNGPSVLGLLAIGDKETLVPDVERTVRYIKERIIDRPSLASVTAEEIAEALQMPQARAERGLLLASTVSGFYSGASGSPHGYSSVSLGREDGISELLAFIDMPTLLSERFPPEPPQVTPPHRPREPDALLQDRNTAFILMSMDPLDASLADVANVIKSTCAAFGISAKRIDDIEHQDRITDRILDMIERSEFIIADLSGERPNVYYEVGYAHALHKRPILVRKAGTQLHFDLAVHNAPEYRNITELGSLLRRRFEAILGRAAERSNEELQRTALATEAALASLARRIHYLCAAAKLRALGSRIRSGVMMLDDAALETIASQYFARAHLTLRSRLICPNLPGLYFDVTPALTDGIIGVFVHRETGEIQIFGFRDVNESRRRLERAGKPYNPCVGVEQMLLGEARN